MSSTLNLHTDNTRGARAPDLLAQGTVAWKPVSLKPSKASRLVFLTDPHGLAVEQYKLLRRRLRSVQPQGGVVMVTSPGPGDGKTMTSINLAWSLAESGHQTCLVDLDFRAPGMGRALGISSEQGVEAAMSGKGTLSSAGLAIAECPLHIYPVKQRLQTPKKYLAASVLSPFIESLKNTYEWVILDLVPVIPMSDVSEVLPYVDGAVLVVRTGKTPAELITPAIETIGAKLRGVVLNDSEIKGSAYYGDYGQRNE